MDQESIRAKIMECARLAEELQAIGKHILDRHASGDTTEDFLREIPAFNTKFEELHMALDTLPLASEMDMPKESVTALDPMTALSDAIKNLMQTHDNVSHIVAEMSGETMHRLRVIREARGIFDRFVKLPGHQKPRFYDKQG
jgi:hypothetical protein